MSHFASRVSQWEFAVLGAVMKEYRAHVTGATFEGRVPTLAGLVQGKLREIGEVLDRMNRELPSAV